MKLHFLCKYINTTEVKSYNLNCEIATFANLLTYFFIDFLS